MKIIIQRDVKGGNTKIFVNILSPVTSQCTHSLQKWHYRSSEQSLVLNAYQSH